MRSLFILFLLFISVCTFSQKEYTLDQILNDFLQNHPLHGDYVRLNAIADETKANLKVNYLPSLDLNAQATYQSDVITLDIDIPGIDIPSPSKDQYKLNLDVTQTIYDAGITKKNLEIESEKLKYSLAELNANINKDKEWVIDLYYNFLLLQENRKILNVSLDYLKNNRKVVEAAYKNGVVLETDLDLMDVEILNLEQNIAGIDTKMVSVLNILSEKTGIFLEFGDCQFQNTKLEEPDGYLLKRAELEMFDQNKVLLERYIDLQNSKRLPKVFVFGQLGYGKPGLNILSQDFETYYYAGAGVKWNVWDWNKVNREKEILQIRSAMIDSQQKNFEDNIENALISLDAEISTHKANLENNKKILEMRKKISGTYQTQLEKGSIRTIDYLNVLDEEKKAALSLASEELLYQKAIAMYKFYQGEL